MTAAYGPMPYPEERALDDAVVQGVTPTRILAVLFPVWCVEVEATVTDGEPYALIDKFVERGIAEASLTTPAELAGFLGLDEVVVTRAVRFLTAIGHVGARDGQLAVTELGFRSLHDDKRYTVTVRDRRKLYFDAFTSRPLTRRYYDSRAVTLLDAATGSAVQAARAGPRFHTLASLTSFDSHALTRLAASAERDRFNLPERIDEPRVVSVPRTVFLPLYVVRGIRSDGRLCCLSYSQASDTADEDLAPFVEAGPLPGLLDGELEDGRTGTDEKRARAWLGGRGLTSVRPHQTSHGTWQVDVPPEAFEGDGRVPLAKVGSYAMLGSGLLRVWCASEEVRRRALLERIGAYLAYRAQPVAADARTQLGRFARQLDLGTVDAATLSRMATDANHRGLAAQLARLARTDPVTS